MSYFESKFQLDWVFSLPCFKDFPIMAPQAQQQTRVNLSRISIVMPCYNEQEAIPSVIPRVLDCLSLLKTKKAISDFELIVVNDQSTDLSVEMLNSFDGVQVIHTRGEGRGYGKALKLGFLQAKGDWIGFLDVDNSYRPEDISLFVDEINQGNADFIMGQRYFSEQGMSLTRGLGNWLYVILAKVLYKSHLDDVCSGFRFFHRRHLEDVTAIPEQGLDFSIHLTLKMISQTQIKPIPIQYDPRLGESKLSVLSDGWAFLKVLISLKIRSTGGVVKHSRV